MLFLIIRQALNINVILVLYCEYHLYKISHLYYNNISGNLGITEIKYNESDPRSGRSVSIRRQPAPDNRHLQDLLQVPTHIKTPACPVKKECSSSTIFSQVTLFIRGCDRKYS